MEMRLIIMALICLCIAQLAFAVEDNFLFSSQVAQQRFVNLSKQYRCAVCKSQSVFDSNSTVAQDMREQIYDSINAGLSDTAISSLLVEQYGEHIVLKPPVKLSTGLLWFGPLMMFGIAAGVSYRYFKIAAPPLTC